MSRLIPQADMTADEIVECVTHAGAIIGLCERAAWSDLQNGPEKNFNQVAEDIQFTLGLARELLVPVQDALESHEGIVAQDKEATDAS